MSRNEGKMTFRVRDDIDPEVKQKFRDVVNRTDLRDFGSDELKEIVSTTTYWFRGIEDALPHAQVVSGRTSSSLPPSDRNFYEATLSLDELRYRDQTTGLSNRRHFLEQLEPMVAAAAAGRNVV